MWALPMSRRTMYEELLQIKSNVWYNTLEKWTEAKYGQKSEKHCRAQKQPNPTPMIQPNHDSGAHFHVKILFKIDYPR